jgi:SAM-dependent methyltransferase
MIVLNFACITQRTSSLFEKFRPLTAYTLDISGSIAGILVFMAFSALQAPAWGWFIVVGLIFVLGLRRMDGRIHWVSLVPLAAVVVMAFLPEARTLTDPTLDKYFVRWSPYQLVNLKGNTLFVNNIGHQEIWDEARLKQGGNTTAPFYATPHRLRQKAGLPPYRRVLVIGSGLGNDVAVALTYGAERVDAVEIDPVIAAIGRDRNNLKPYQDPRVRLIVDDARAVLTRAKEPYDLIIFALTDSLMKVSSLAQLRLESFLYTVDSIKRAYQLLSPDGDIVLYNFYRHEWLVERLRNVLRNATGKEPEVLKQWEFRFCQFRVGRLSKPGAVQEGPAPVLPNDDWPFPYLQRKCIPVFYLMALLVMSALLGIFAGILARMQGRTRLRNSGPLRLGFFAMGAAFLLLESKSVVQFSLLYGTTWWNSSIVFFSALLLVLLANRLAQFLPSRSARTWIPVLLLASCVLTFAVPLTRFLYLGSPIGRLVLAGLFLFLPIFFANLLFSVKFRDQKLASDLFGWNLLGAAIGGILEYTSMMVGYNALALLVLVLYATTIYMFALDDRREKARA